MRILVVDDEPLLRTLMRTILKAWGHEVILAENGAEAWKILQEQSIPLVLCDWMMPVMDGMEFCRLVRSGELTRYVYVILLTARDERADYFVGMEAGADDFVVKPVDQRALQVRLRAAERIINLQRSLAEHNAELAHTNKELQGAYQRINDDLKHAADAQRSLLPPPLREIGNLTFHSMFLPSAIVSGDIFNYFSINHDMTALYTLDVSGHGIRSALTSVMFSRLLTPEAFQRDGDVEIIAPDGVVDDLNRRFQDRLGVDEYLTMLCATYDQRTGILRLCQAGHPGPLLQRADGGIRQLGQGGFPVGLLPFAEYETFDLALHAGDRLVLFSDGVTECMNPAGEQFGEDRLEDLLRRYSERRAGDLITALMGELRDWNGSETFNDDVSVIAVEVK